MQNQEKFSILLVDDDPTVIRVLNHILSGFSPVRFATSGRTALKLARESVPDLVILDVDMPEISGFEVCKQLKTDPKLASVPIVFITGHQSPQLQSKGIEMGAADFMEKPPHAPLVLARVRTYQKLKHLSDTLTETLKSAVTMDFLTGTVTRSWMEKTLTEEWLRTQRTAAPLSLLLADIEDFNGINAVYGEERGEACLKAVADALRSAANRPIDVIGRWAGGQFAVLLPETDAAGCEVVARRAIDAVAALKIPHPDTADQGGCIALSIGGVHLGGSRPPNGDLPVAASPHDLVRIAEKALVAARFVDGRRLIMSEFAAADVSGLAAR